MSIKIHHGPPGSYKTAGAVTDDLIPALQKSRSIVTNVRGITLDKIHENFDNISDDFVLHWIDTTTREGRERLGAWFTWAPHGALIFIDEAQAIFPKRWKEKDLESFTIDVDKAKELNRPANWWDAWDMHRHYNWDVILTTPDITKIRDDIRDASELAYKHKNQGLYGWLFKGSYLEGVHSKDNNGATVSNFINVKQKRIAKDALTWKLYQSTATGEISDTIAGFNIFSNPRLIIGLAVLGCAFLYLGFYGHNPLDSEKNNPLPVQSFKTNPNVPPKAYPLKASNNVADSGVIGQVSQVSDALTPPPVEKMHPLQGYIFNYSGKMQVSGKTTHFFKLYNEQGFNHSVTSPDLIGLGYQIKAVSSCSVYLYYNNETIYASCNPVI